MKKKWTPDKVKELLRMYRKGISIHILTHKFDCSKIAIYKQISIYKQKEVNQ